MAYLGGEHAVTRHCPPKPVSLGTQVNPWRAMACNPPFPAIARPYPPDWKLRLKIEERIWRALAGSRLVPPLEWRSMADLNIMNINWRILAERGVLWRELPSTTWRATDLLVSGSQQP